jgi:MFS family permease
MTASTRHGWYVVAVLTLANVSGFVDRQLLSLLVVPIKLDLGISDTEMSYLMGLSFSVLYTALGLPIARWADRGNRPAIIAGGVALWSVMTMLCGVARTYARLLLARIGVGIGEAALAAPAVSLISDYFPRERLGTAMSVYSLGVFLGSGLAYVVGGWAVGRMSVMGTPTLPFVGEISPWQASFLVVGAPGFVIAALMLTIREPRPIAARSTAGAPLSSLWEYLGIHRRAFVTLCGGFSALATVNYGIAAWLATFLARTYGWAPSRAGVIQGVLTMTVGVAGVLAGGRVADRYVRRGRADGRLRVGIIGAVGMLVSATAYPLMPTAVLAVAWLVVVNFFAAFPWGAAPAAAAELFPAPLRAQGVAIYFFVLNLVSATLGPTLVALLTDYVFRNERAIGYSLAVVNVVGMSVGIGLLRRGVGR